MIDVRKSLPWLGAVVSVLALARFLVKRATPLVKLH